MKCRKKWAAVLAGTLLLTGCGLLPQEARLPHAPVAEEVEDIEHKLTVVMRGDVEITQSVRCEYRPAVSQSLSFSVGGERLRRLFVQPGDTVQAGDILAELEMGDLEDRKGCLEREAAQLELKLSQLEETRDLDVRKAQAAVDRAGSGDALREAKEAKERLETAYEQSKKELEDTLFIREQELEELEEQIRQHRIYAPFDGSVTYCKTMEEGDLSSETEKVVTISDVTSSVFLVTGEDAALFAVGDTVMVNYAKTEHEGTVEDPTRLGLEAESGTAFIRLETPDPTLEEGTLGTIQMVLERAENVLYVKSGAVKKMQDRSVVYYVDAEGMKSMKDVKTGLDNGTFVEITDGLEEGEEIIDE